MDRERGNAQRTERRVWKTRGGAALTKEKSVSFAVTRLNLLEGGFARTYSVAAL